VFDGDDLSGAWRLFYLDRFTGQDTGTLNTWCLEASTSP
jgi:subtilisin-like proprotein convertase family protein